jgi:alpha-glucan, water dikinase
MSNISSSPTSPEEALRNWVPGADTLRQIIPLDNGKTLAVAITTDSSGVCVRLASDTDGPLVLHWGLAYRFRGEWLLPEERYRPSGTSIFGETAARTPFTDRERLRYLEILFRKPTEGDEPRALRFVLFGPQGDQWIKSKNTEMTVPLFQPQGDARLGAPLLADLAEQIIGPEMGASSWTLMHRFNLAHDLLGQAEKDADALALLYVWLRYSAQRQLDWQRNYNTKPRELSHAQDKLTIRIANICRSLSEQHSASKSGVNGRLWARMMLTTLGRGGEGQRVRDEILHIMHRNGLKETTGNFIEEWHQKLHNNTTPDDVVICEAFLAFLHSDGDLDVFHKTLEDGGVTRERLLSFERPIRNEPVFVGEKKDVLISEFENFLRVLKSVHSGTDLDTAINAAGGSMNEDLRKKIDGLLGLRGKKAGVEKLVPAVTAARESLRQVMANSRDNALRDLLFLDLALEEYLRGQIERQKLGELSPDVLTGLGTGVLRNVALSVDSPELPILAKHWTTLLSRPAAQRWSDRDWALQARSVAERAAHWVAEFSHTVYQHLQPKADVLGETFQASEYVRSLFAEEAVRGGPAFALSLVLKQLDPLLRKSAGLGGWQVISPASTGGRIRQTARLVDVQTERFAEPTILLADEVAGSEEIPQNVMAVLTTDMPDLVSHLAVRARNAHVLLATCYEPEVFGSLQALKDREVVLSLTPSGDLEFREGHADAALRNGKPATPAGLAQMVKPRADLPWVLTQEQFAPGVVGGKSNNLNGLRGKVADWIRLPASLALPFGTFEKVLASVENQGFRRGYESLLATMDGDGSKLLSVRELLGRLVVPEGLQAALAEAWGRAGLPDVPWEKRWSAICKVWASKWNDRAFLSRRARSVPHEQLLMAVLVQQVVEAEYAFVIHTVNPITGDRDEVFAEVVLGLGETLVGNYPGRALGFTYRKSDGRVSVLSYPSKGVGLYGRGVIFRSDSNGEDLEDFAGAGLYDSFLAQPPEERLLDYATDKLMTDTGFREQMLQEIGKVGVEVERTLGSPQDVEGAVSAGTYTVVQTRPQVGL